MNKSRRKFMALPLLLAMVIPFAYNSCQAGLLGGRGFNSAGSTSCKPVMYNGAVKNLKDFDSAPNPFSGGKVQLRETATTDALSKVEAPVDIKAGSELSYLADNACLQMNRDEFSSNSLSHRAFSSGFLNTALSVQAYSWTLERPYSESELTALTNKEPCVLGLSWNHEYRLQAYNDPSRINQTHLSVIHADESYSYFYNGGGGMDATTGEPVLIAVVDTGVDWQHPDLYGNLWQHSLGIGIDITTYPGNNISYNPMDISSIGHGTHVTGLIAALTNNGIGTSGVMPFRAKIMPIKLFSADANGGIATNSTHFANALRFAWENNAKVINLSIGSLTAGPSTDAIADQAVSAAVAAGAVVVTVIGNADSPATGVEVNGTTLSSIPGMYASRSGVLGVGSYDTQTGLRSSFSHYSTLYAEVGAPGADIGTTGIYSTLPRTLSSYGRLAGTSQAAPIVSAAAGLVMRLIKDATNVWPSPQEVERLILASAEKSAALQPFFKDGNKLDLLRLVQRINADYPSTKDGSLDLSSVGCQ